MPSICEVPGCGKGAVAKGLCNMHRQRYARHGDVSATRPEGWGKGRNHPLYERWRSMRRSARLKNGHVPEWSDFWAFLRDVGDPLNDTARLYRLDESKPFGPGNVTWRERVQDKPSGQTREERNAYMRQWTQERPHLRQAQYLRRHYGIGLAEYEVMFVAQEGRCAICRQEETALDHKGRARLLAVDHCHATGKVRGLLCHLCNNGLGAFKDQRARLVAAIAYLDALVVSGEERPTA